MHLEIIDIGYALIRVPPEASEHEREQLIALAKRELAEAGEQDKDAAVESRVITAARAVPKLVQAALGLGTVSREVHDARLAVCHSCPGGHYKSGVCGELARRTGRTCGCVVDRKAWLKNETCPNGYWKT